MIENIDGAYDCTKTLSLVRDMRYKDRAGVDWDGIIREWRLGIAPVREIAGRFGVAHTTILRRMEKDDILRDKTDQVRAVIHAIVSGDDINKAGERGAEVINRHLTWAGQMGELSSGMLEDLLAIRNGESRPGVIGERETISDVGIKVASMLEKAVKLERLSLSLDREQKTGSTAELQVCLVPCYAPEPDDND